MAQILYLEHSVESLARGGPWLLGTIVPGVSRWRVLKEAETEVHGGSSRRKLYGCAVTLLQAHAPMQGASGSPVFEQLLVTWSQVSSTSIGTACLGGAGEIASSKYLLARTLGLQETAHAFRFLHPYANASLTNLFA